MKHITDKIALEWAERQGLYGIPTMTLRCAISDARSIPELATAEQPSCGQDARDAARYRYLRDFPPRARAKKEGNTQPSLNDMWVSAFLNPTPGTIPTMDILEGNALDARIDAAIAAQQRQGEQK